MKPQHLIEDVVVLLRELEKYTLRDKIIAVAGIRREMAKHVDGTPWSGAFDDVYSEEEAE